MSSSAVGFVLTLNVPVKALLNPEVSTVTLPGVKFRIPPLAVARVHVLPVPLAKPGTGPGVLLAVSETSRRVNGLPAVDSRFSAPLMLSASHPALFVALFS